MTPRVKAGKWSTINGDKQEKLAIRISSKTDIKLHRTARAFEISRRHFVAFAITIAPGISGFVQIGPFFHPIDQLPRRIAREV